MDKRRSGIMNGRGVSGATGGATAAGVAADGAMLVPAAPPPIAPTAATAVRQPGDSFTELVARHRRAALPPGWTPEQCAVKSDRQAEWIAAVCAAEGAAGVAAVVAFPCACDFFAGSTDWAGSAGGVMAAFGADAPVTADLHADDKSLAFACRQSTISGLVGAIQEQCAATSSSVQARRTASNRSSCDAAVGVWLALGAAGVAAVGVTASAAGGVSAEAGAAGGAPATASMAALHDGERLSRLPSRHSSAALPPGSTPEHLAMKSERQDERIASRCVVVGC